MLLELGHHIKISDGYISRWWCDGNGHFKMAAKSSTGTNTNEPGPAGHCTGDYASKHQKTLTGASLVQQSMVITNKWLTNRVSTWRSILRRVVGVQGRKALACCWPRWVGALGRIYKVSTFWYPFTISPGLVDSTLCICNTYVLKLLLWLTLTALNSETYRPGP